MVGTCAVPTICDFLRHEILLRDITEGGMKGEVTRGRKRLDMLSDLKTTTGYVEVK